MTPAQIALVRASFAKALPISGRVAHAFYTRLFQTAPETRRLFTGDMEAQGQKLMLTLASVVAELDRLDRLLPPVIELARRHVGYGVQDRHYALVGAALIETLREALGPAFTAQVEEAWVTAYTLLSEAMIGSVRRAA